MRSSLTPAGPLAKGGKTRRAATSRTPGLTEFCAALETAGVDRMCLFENRPSSPSNAVFVGCSPNGSHAITSAVSLDSKLAGYASVSRLVSERPDRWLEDWPLWQERPLLPSTALARVTLVVGDASPDSVLGVVLLLARLAALEPGQIAERWLSPAERWKAEGMAEDPFREWASLASALAHARFPVAAQPNDQDMVAAWTDALRFCAGCIGRGFDPGAIPPSRDWDLWRRAEAALQQEEQTYRDWLPHALQVQLSLPLVGSGRRLLVDALMFSEDQPTGSGKVFYRNDTHAPLGRGFALAAHHRPPGHGLSSDITISIDARRGVHLFDLWEELERRECSAWRRAGVQRPNWNPRVGIAGVEPEWNEPWFINPARTLIGAPRDVRERENGETRLGSLLSWEEIKDAIWTVYNPLQRVLVLVPGVADPVPLLDVTPLQSHRGDKRLILADWPRLSVGQAPVRALGSAPIFERVIAALIDRDDPHRPIAVDDLSAPIGWRRVDLDGGLAIVTEKGLFVLDDWHETPRLALDIIHQCFDRASRLEHDLSELELRHVRRLAREFREWLDGSLRLTERRGFVREAASLAVRLAELRTNAVAIPRDVNSRLIWEALDRQWALERRLAVAEQQIRTISDSVKSIGDARVRRITHYVALIGFPYAFSSGLAMPLARLIAPLISTSTEPPAWFAPASFSVIAALVWLVLRHDTPTKSEDRP